MKPGWPAIGFALTLCACSSISAGPDDLPAVKYVPGQSYFGRNNYIEYIAGNAPVIFTVPHGGSLTPAEIPDRLASACGGTATTVTDLNTINLVRTMQERYFARFGKYPHVVITHLSRRKIDTNRSIDEAACGDPQAQTAYREWHQFIDLAEGSVVASFGGGFYLDIHGHGHSVPRLEIGYLLTASQLNLDDNAIDGTVAYENASSLRSLSLAAPVSFSALIRGQLGLGTLFAANGFRAVPSAAEPSPGADAYFDGGQNTLLHTCSALAGTLNAVGRGDVCGVQIEANMVGVRDTDANRQRFGDVTALVLEQYLAAHSSLDLRR